MTDAPYVEQAPTGFVTEYAITLGIFDDGDLVPTVVFGVVLPYPNCNLWFLVTEMCVELLKAARKEYGSKIPRHAAYWSGSTREVLHEDSLAALQQTAHTQGVEGDDPVPEGT